MHSISSDEQILRLDFINNTIDYQSFLGHIMNAITFQFISTVQSSIHPRSNLDIAHLLFLS